MLKPSQAEFLLVLLVGCCFRFISSSDSFRVLSCRTDREVDKKEVKKSICKKKNSSLSVSVLHSGCVSLCSDFKGERADPLCGLLAWPWLIRLMPPHGLHVWAGLLVREIGTERNKKKTRHHFSFCARMIF